jgi:hypothetical protein
MLRREAQQKVVSGEFFSLFLYAAEVVVRSVLVLTICSCA